MIYKGIELYNISELVMEEETKQIIGCRIPDVVRRELNQLAQIIAFNNAACELRFNLVGESAKITLSLTNPQDYPLGAAMAEIYHGSFAEPDPVYITSDPSEVIIKKHEKIEILKQIEKEENLPFDSELIRIILPYSARIKIVDIEGEVALPRAEQTPGQKMLMYGSSITHGSCAIHPTGTYAMKTAAKLGVDLINLGSQGSALLEGAMADYIADRTDWDFAFLELGINVIWDIVKAEHTPVEVFAERLKYFLTRIAQSNPDKWIFCTDIYTNDSDYREDDEMTEKYRKAVKKQVADLKLPKLVHLPGRTLLPSGKGLSTDLIHPSIEGMDIIATNLFRQIEERIRS